MLDREGYVDDEAFRSAVMPFSTMVRELADAGYTEGPNGVWDVRPPAVESQAMAELDQQSAFAGVWDDVPIDTALTHVGLLLTAAEDAMRTYASAVIADRPPLYAYIPVGRSALELLALAHWLGEPGIGTGERVRRSINERIASAWEQSRLRAAMNPEPGRQARLLRAAEKGYQLTKSSKAKFRQLAPERPSITKHVQRLLGNDDLGRTLYSYASAVSHGVLWGLAERVEVPADATGPVVTGALAHSCRNVAVMASALVLAHKRAFGGFAGYMGWDVSQWMGAVAQADSTVIRFLGTPRPAHLDPVEAAPEWQLAGVGGGLWLPEPGSVGAASPDRAGGPKR